MDRIAPSEIKTHRFSRILMSLSLFFLTLSGMAQMPIAKRYYLSDLPGLGWLADFYITHYIHYVSGFLFTLLVFYYAADYIMNKAVRKRITKFGIIRLIVLTVLLISGVIMVIKNFTLYLMDPSGIVVLNIIHLSLAMLFIAMVITKKMFKLNYWKYKI